MVRPGRPLVNGWLVPALLPLLLVSAPWTARGDCGRRAAAGAGASLEVAGLDELASIGAAARPIETGASTPGPPAAPCRGLRCSSGSGSAAPGAVPPVVRRVDIGGWLVLGSKPAPERTGSVAFLDDAPAPSERADRLDRPPR